MKKILSLVMVLTLAICMLSAAVAEAPSVEWDREADVVVIGFGPAGAMAAKAAIENGATALVVEKANEEFAGGSAPTAMGFMFAPYTAEAIFNSSMGRISMETATQIADRGNAAIDWLSDNGARMNGQVFERNGRGFYDALLEKVEPVGIEVLYETPAENLIQDPETKEIWGVQCTDASGNVINIKANKGVVIATGGYIENRDLMTRFHFADMPNYANIGAPTQTGDGLLMALKAGAALDGVSNQQIEWYGMAYKKASDEMGTGILHMNDAMAPDARIFVNAAGKRFMDEEMYLTHTKEQLPLFEYDGTFPVFNSFKNFPMYTIFDSSMYDAGPVGPRDYYCGYASLYDIYNWSEDNEAELERGWLVKADTIEELVEKLAAQSGNDPIDAEALKATIEAYNAACEAGVDAEFGRDGFMLSPIAAAPFYAAEIEPAAVYTIGGLVCNDEMQTLDWDGNPIPRLYHAGDVGQPTKFMIQALQGALSTGELAGEACAKLESH